VLGCEVPSNGQMSIDSSALAKPGR